MKILLLLLLALPAHAKDCALLLAAPPRQLPIITPDRAFQAYMEDLLADVILETEDLLVLKEGLEQGFVPNPITDAVIFRNSEAHVHEDAFQARIERGNLSVGEQLRWVNEQIAKREYNRERQRVTQEKTHEITLEDLFPEARMVAIKGGDFTMGSPEGEVGRRDNENQVPVTLSPFAMMDAPVTQQIWMAVMGGNPSSFVRAEHPVKNLFWNEVQEFIKRLNMQLGLKGEERYRLPTEAQWEYAARAGTETAYFFGDDPGELEKYAVFDADGTAPVRSKDPNGYGLYDMSGNVWEWVEDWYHPVLNGGDDPVQTTASTFRIIRGGSWDDYARHLRSANRDYVNPRFRRNYVGFRLVRPR